MSQENVQLVRETLEGFCHETWRSREQIDVWDPDVVYHPREDEPDTRTAYGRDAWEAIMDGFMAAFAEVTFDVEETFDAGDWVIASTILHGRGVASGIEVDDRYVFAYKLRDGRVVEGREYHTMDQAKEDVARVTAEDSTPSTLGRPRLAPGPQRPSRPAPTRRGTS